MYFDLAMMSLQGMAEIMQINFHANFEKYEHLHVNANLCMHTITHM